VVNELDALRDVISRHAHNELRSTGVAGITIMASDAPTQPRSGVGDPSFAMVVQGGKRTLIGDEVFDYRVGQFLVTSLQLPVTGLVTEARPDGPFLGFSITLEPLEVAALVVAAAAAGGGGHPPTEPTGIGVDDADDQLLGAAGRLVGLLDSPRDAPILASVYRREILWRLLTGPKASIVRQIGLEDGPSSHIVRTVRWLLLHYREPVTISQLAAMAGMSQAAFHRHFRESTRLTPIQ
jgi:AraC-type transcriptional regulator N-terminus